MQNGSLNKWDERYDQKIFFYGTEPNYYVARILPELESGRGLFLAEGEGRNAVFAAGLGHEVTAVDGSAVGRRKALELAAARGVTLDYRLGDLTCDRWPTECWDFVVLCFAHLPPETMPDVHRQVAASLRPGGTLILNSFAKAQYGRKSGGPPRLDWLHDIDELFLQFPGLSLVGEEKEVDLRESVGHHGLAMVIEMTGIKSG
jgi:SAM-dependent methyltransferase